MGFCAGLAVLFGCLGAGAGEAPVPAVDGCKGVTRPSEDVTLSFAFSGRIAGISVKEGDPVSPESPKVLVQQDDSVERAELAHLEAQAKDTIRIRAAEAQLDLRKVQLEKTREAYQKNRAATLLELKERELDVKIAELSVELARFEHEQHGRKYEQMKLQVERMRLRSPIKGRVEKVFVRVGETVSAESRPDADGVLRRPSSVIRIVNIDPLWVDVEVDRHRAEGLKVGDAARVHFDEGRSRLFADGTVTHKPSVADAGSDTLMLRVQVPNPSARTAGERVIVTFPAGANAAGNAAPGELSGAAGGGKE